MGARVQGLSFQSSSRTVCLESCERWLNYSGTCHTHTRPWIKFWNSGFVKTQLWPLQPFPHWTRWRFSAYHWLSEWTAWCWQRKIQNKNKEETEQLLYESLKYRRKHLGIFGWLAVASRFWNTTKITLEIQSYTWLQILFKHFRNVLQQS